MCRIEWARCGIECSTRCSMNSPVSCRSQLILTDPSKCFWLIDFDSGLYSGFGFFAGVFGASGAWSGTSTGPKDSGSPITTEVGRDFRWPCSWWVCLMILFTRFQFSMTSVALLMTPIPIYFQIKLWFSWSNNLKLANLLKMSMVKDERFEKGVCERS